MGNVQSLSHSKWEYIYHITWIPKYRKKIIYKELRKYLGEVFKELARHCTLTPRSLKLCLRWRSRRWKGLLMDDLLFYLFPVLYLPFFLSYY